MCVVVGPWMQVHKNRKRKCLRNVMSVNVTLMSMSVVWCVLMCFLGIIVHECIKRDAKNEFLVLLK